WLHYEDSAPPRRDAEPPYHRSILLPLPVKDADGQPRARVGLVADWLYQDLTASLGRSADESRAAIPIPAPETWSFSCQTFGMYRISWPRIAFVRQVARSLCQQLVRDWMSKDAAAVRQQVKDSVAQELNRLGLGGERLL